MISRSPDESDNSSGSTEEALGSGGNASPEDPTVGMSRTSSSHRLPQLAQVGDYRICKELGRGGMGIVYEATELSLQRQVALKVLPSAAHLDSMRAKRFRNESRAAAQLNHPNIIPVYAVGAADGVSYFAMHLVEGKDFSKLIRGIRHDLIERKPKSRTVRPSTTVDDASVTVVSEKPKSRPRSSNAHRADSEEQSRMELSASDFNSRSGRPSTTYRAAATVARLGIRVADALQHAHDTGIVHRDIKPSNLMMDNHGKVWVTDFGLAHVRNSPSMTRTGDMLGTLRYMSPEQATGVRALIDHRTDIYSLGVTLCEILTLQRIVKGDNNEEVLKEVVYGAPVRVRRIDPGVPEDMAIILEKAMSKNPLERYATAGEMAEDLHRFLHNEAIKAKRPGVAKRCIQWLGRHKAAAAAIVSSLGILFVTSLVATAVVAFAWQAEAAQLVKTKRALSVSEGLRMLLNSSSIISESPGLSQALALEGAPAVPGFEANQTLLAASNANHEYAMVTPRASLSTQIEISPNGSLAISCAPQGNAMSPAFLHSMDDGRTLRQLDGGNIASATFSPSGEVVVTSEVGNEASPGQVTVWETPTGRSMRVFPDATLGRLHAGAFSSDGARLVLCQGNEATVFVLADQQKVVLRGHAEAISHAEFSPDNSKILTVSGDKSVRVWDSSTGKEIRSAIIYDTEQPTQAHFTASSNQVLVRDRDAIKLYGTEPDPARLEPQAKAPLLFMEPSRSQEQVALHGIHTVRIVSSVNLEPVCEIDLRAETIQRVRFHPTQKQLLVTCGEVMYLFDSETGRQLGDFRGHTSSILDATLAAGAPVLASVAADRTVRLWHSQSGYEQRSFEAPAIAYEIASTLSSTNSDDTLIAAYSEPNYRTTVRGTDGQLTGISLAGARGAGTVNCKNLVTVQGRIVTVTEADTSRQIYQGTFSDILTSANTQLVDSNQHLLVHTKAGEAYLVELETGARRRVSEPGVAVTNVFVSPDYSFFVLTSESGGKGRYLAISPATGEVVWDRRHDWAIRYIQTSSDSKRLGLVDASGTVHLWSLDDWTLLAAFPSDERPVNRFAFASTGVVTWHHRENANVRFYGSLDASDFQEYPASGVVSVDAHESQPHIAIGTSESASIWSPASQETEPLVERACRHVHLTADRVALLLGGNETDPPELQLRSLESGELLYSEHLDLAPWSLGFDEGSRRWVLTESGYCANLFHYDSSEFAFTSVAHSTPIIWVGFSASLKRLITVSEDGLILISDETGRLLHRIAERRQPTTAAALDAKGEALLVGGKNGELVLWNVVDGNEMVQLGGHEANIRSIRFDESGNKAITVAEGEPVRLWDLRNHSSTEFAIKAPLHAEISPAGTHALVVAGDENGRPTNVWLVVAATGEEIDVTQQPQGTRAALFSPDGQRIGLLRADRMLQILQVGNLMKDCELATAAGTTRFAFSVDGAQVLTASSDAYSLWSLTTCNEQLKVPGQRGLRISLNDQWQPFSRDNRWFHTDSIPAKHPNNPNDFARSISKRSLSQDERLRFRVDLADLPTD